MLFLVMDVQIKTPFRMILAGPSMSGKTTLIRKLLVNGEKMFDRQFVKILWCYGQFQNETFAKIKKEVPNVEFHEGLPENIQTQFNTSHPNLVILDDLMADASKDERIAKLFIMTSHHLNISLAYLTQNIFHKGTQSRTISLNADIILLTKNTRDKSQIQYLARQLAPDRPKFIQESYQDATSIPYGYLFIDLKPETPEQIRVRTGIFPGEVHVAYLRK